MDYIEILKHYTECDDIKDEDLLDEAIASLESNFELMSEDELLHHNRVKAIAYLALRHIKGA